MLGPTASVCWGKTTFACCSEEDAHRAMRVRRWTCDMTAQFLRDHGVPEACVQTMAAARVNGQILFMLWDKADAGFGSHGFGSQVHQVVVDVLVPAHWVSTPVPADVLAAWPGLKAPLPVFGKRTMENHNTDGVCGLFFAVMNGYGTGRPALVGPSYFRIDFEELWRQPTVQSALAVALCHAHLGPEEDPYAGGAVNRVFAGYRADPATIHLAVRGHNGVVAPLAKWPPTEYLQGHARVRESPPGVLFDGDELVYGLDILPPQGRPLVQRVRVVVAALAAGALFIWCSVRRK